MPHVRLKIHVTGTFHGIEGGVPLGTVVEVSEFDAARYVKNDIAEHISVPEVEEESSVVSPVVESAVVKRRGRPRKENTWHDEHAKGWSKVD
jgi:hypothetical protein